MNTSCVISKASSSDLQKVFELEKLVWNEEVTNWYDLAMFLMFGHFLVAKIEGKVVGAIHGFVTNNSEIYVNDWIVDPSYQHRKIGTKLYKRFFKLVGRKSIVSLVDVKNIISIEAHIALGFKKVKKVNDPFFCHFYNGDTENRILMRRRVPRAIMFQSSQSKLTAETNAPAAHSS